MAIQPSKLIKQIFDQTATMMATVECQTIADCDKKNYEPILLGIRAIENYNEFDGAKVENWLRSRLVDGNRGPITSIRFGREHSPVLYLTVTGSVRKSNGDYRKLNAKERREFAQTIAGEGKSLISADESNVVAPGVVRIWWD